ncbi:MarR family winged helix-turn-helix transcriptional regulator [Acidihalobacter ferrooxydans]|uniref:HTH marR-type domain-containing protein n=1 Tax=Acidihalobacter ferrooxydans TaxID=1765967 RepID=A0A1P8UEI6_9GAMM|nr:MarR family transcriptional regulator [Acidihalobacter ferrooxydans]APZ42208.1 hypothetical protein BW247_03125 [Acidihalobacter ferrooxydans]
MTEQHTTFERLAAIEQRIDATQARFPEFPRRTALILRLIRHVHSEGQDMLNAQLRPFGLCYSEYGILMMLYSNAGHGINPSELSVASGEKGANLTRICNALFKRGLIDRVPSLEDRRKVVLSLSTQGEALIERLLPVISAESEQHLNGFGTDDLAQLEDLLKRMLENMEQHAARRPE